MKRRSISGERSSSIGRSSMTEEQFATYLAGLRDNSRVNRPGGARPPPLSFRSKRDSTDRSTTGRPSIGSASFQSESSTSHQRTPSDAGKLRSGRPSMTGSFVSQYSTNTMSGRDYYPEKPARPPLKPSEVVPSATYIERGQRWMEKEEAFSLRQAMEAMDLEDQAKKDRPQDDETRLYNAALEEAADLVQQHQKGVKPRQPGQPYHYKSHLRKNSYAHARAASAGRYGSDIVPTGLARDSSRSCSGSSAGSERAPSPESGRESQELRREASTATTNPKPYPALSSGSRAGTGGRRRSSMKRNISGEIEKPFSGDQIWEEPEGNTSERHSRQIHSLKPLGVTAKSNPNKVQFASEPLATDPAVPAKRLSRYEIHKNPPSQSRNPDYTMNNTSGSPRPSTDVPTKSGIEIRGDDIRQATSMHIRDRSPKLPTPSAVSDSPGRPIVSFDKNWKAPEEATDAKPEESRRFRFGIPKERSGQTPQPPLPSLVLTPTAEASATSPRPSRTPDIPSIQISSDDSPQVPAIAISDDASTVPAIVLPKDDDNSSIPSISVSVSTTPENTKKPSARPLPVPRSTPSQFSNNQGGRLQNRWPPAPSPSHRATAMCGECHFPIEGRFIALHDAPERYHPQCFCCYKCGTELEALEIHKEPDNLRNDRVDRIRRRAAGEILDEEPGKTMGEDGDERTRYFCYLDWNEQFAPRCKSCKTPILGEHLVALGEHWHYGHFFCCECGDPFEKGKPHIEIKGYAWCHTCFGKREERQAPKCKGCKGPLMGEYVKALEALWHEDCFRCTSCKGLFEDGGFFPMGNRAGTVVLCTGCRARELK